MLSEDSKVDIILEKCASDKRKYEEALEKMVDEDYQRWLALIRPEYMEKYIDERIADYIKNNITIKFYANDYLLDVSVYVGDKIITSDTLDLCETIGPLVNASN